MGRQALKRGGGTAAPTTAQLESFVALVRWGKQAAAQAALGRSQSQISRDLSGLEMALGVGLLDRDSRKATPAGDLLLAYAEQVLEGWSVVCERIGGQADITGSVRLVAPDEVHEAVLLPLLTRLRARWDQLKILSLVAGSSAGAEMLRSGAADIGLLPSGDYTGLNTRPLFSGRVCVAVPVNSTWASRKSVPATPGSGTSLLLNGLHAGAMGGMVERAFGGRKERRPPVCELGGGRRTVLDAVAAGLGVAWLLLFEEAGDPLARALPSRVVLRPISGIRAQVPFCLAVRKGRTPGSAVEFVLREILRHFRRE